MYLTGQKKISMCLGRKKCSVLCNKPGTNRTFPAAPTPYRGHGAEEDEEGDESHTPGDRDQYVTVVHRAVVSHVGGRAILTEKRNPETTVLSSFVVIYKNQLQLYSFASNCSYIDIHNIIW